jgi:hypothetical protein
LAARVKAPPQAAVAATAGPTAPDQASGLTAAFDSAGAFDRCDEGRCSGSVIASGLGATATDCLICEDRPDPAAADSGPGSLAGPPFAAIGDVDALSGLSDLASAGTAAPASEISTAAMATLGVLALAARGRRRGLALWKAPWRAVPQPAWAPDDSAPAFRSATASATELSIAVSASAWSAPLN